MLTITSHECRVDLRFDQTTSLLLSVFHYDISTLALRKSAILALRRLKRLFIFQCESFGHARNSFVAGDDSRSPFQAGDHRSGPLSRFSRIRLEADVTTP